MNRKRQEAERIFENLQWQAKRVAKHTMGVDVLISTIRDYARYQYELLEWYVRKVWGDKTFHVRRGALISTIEGLLEDGEKARRRLLNFLFGVQSLSNHKNHKARAHVAILWAVLQPSFLRGEDGKVNTGISMDALVILHLLDEEAQIDERCRAECEEQPKLEEWEIPDNDHPSTDDTYMSEVRAIASKLADLLAPLGRDATLEAVKEIWPNLNTIVDLATEGLFTDGAHHKQWFLERILKETLGDEGFHQHVQSIGEYEPGIAP